MTEAECVFCAIAAGRFPAATVFEDEATVAFLDITAVTRGHTLVIPRHHASDLWEISRTDAAAVMRTVHLMALRIKDVLDPDGLTLFQANRPAGWQDVFHLHVHLVPRTVGDRLHRPWSAMPVGLAALESTRAQLAVRSGATDQAHEAHEAHEARHTISRTRSSRTASQIKDTP